jgi:hypothetical protein
MFDTLFIIGQAASALLFVYGGFLVLMPERKAAVPAHPAIRLRHSHQA